MLNAYVNKSRLAQQPLELSALLRPDVLVLAAALRIPGCVGQFVGSLDSSCVCEKVWTRQQIRPAIARFEQNDLVAFLRAHIECMALLRGKRTWDEHETPALQRKCVKIGLGLLGVEKYDRLAHVPKYFLQPGSHELLARRLIGVFSSVELYFGVLALMAVEAIAPVSFV